MLPLQYLQVRSCRISLVGTCLVQSSPSSFFEIPLWVSIIQLLGQLCHYFVCWSRMRPSSAPWMEWLPMEPNSTNWITAARTLLMMIPALYESVANRCQLEHFGQRMQVCIFWSPHLGLVLWVVVKKLISCCQTLLINWCLASCPGTCGCWIVHCTGIANLPLDYFSWRLTLPIFLF